MEKAIIIIINSYTWKYACNTKLCSKLIEPLNYLE